MSNTAYFFYTTQHCINRIQARVCLTYPLVRDCNTVLCPVACCAAQSGLPPLACVRYRNYVQAESACACAGDFANSSAGGTFEEADGHWLHQPTAVLRAKDESGMVATSALLSLAQPRYDATHHTLTFQVRFCFLQYPRDKLCGVAQRQCLMPVLVNLSMHTSIITAKCLACAPIQSYTALRGAHQPESMRYCIVLCNKIMQRKEVV